MFSTEGCPSFSQINRNLRNNELHYVSVFFQVAFMILNFGLGLILGHSASPRGKRYSAFVINVPNRILDGFAFVCIAAIILQSASKFFYDTQTGRVVIIRPACMIILHRLIATAKNHSPNAYMIKLRNLTFA